MKSKTCNDIHRGTYDQGKRHPRKTRETRALLGSRFKILLADAGLPTETAGRLAFFPSPQVTSRHQRYGVCNGVRRQA
jgi:hypothetical protein